MTPDRQLRGHLIAMLVGAAFLVCRRAESQGNNLARSLGCPARP